MAEQSVTPDLAETLADVLNAALAADPECVSKLLGRAVITENEDALRRAGIPPWKAKGRFPAALSVLGLLNGVLRKAGAAKVIVARGGGHPPKVRSFAAGDREIDIR